MQVYTKILLGMLVGAVLGLTLGPKSAFLEADLYSVTAWDELELRTDRTDPASAVRLPAPKRRSSGEITPLRLPVLETLDVQREDATGASHTLAQWSRVELTYSQALSLRDGDGSIRDQLGVEAIGEVTEVWLRVAHTELESGGFNVWPVPISGLGDTFMGWIRPVGTVFMRLIKMVIVPLVFASLLVGVASLGDIRTLGRLGVRTLGLYLGTTAVAVTIGLLVAHVLQPGNFIDESSRAALAAQFVPAAGDQLDRAAEAPSTIENILNIIPENPVASLVSGDMLQVIFFAVLFGVALTLLEDNKGRSIVVLMDRVQGAMVVIIHIVMKLAPYGVAALVADVVGQSGFSVLQALLVYALAVLVGLALHGVLVYGALVVYLAKLSPRAFLRAIRPAQLIAFSTSSSSAALPVTLQCAEQNLGVSRPVASFVIPLGSTVNMDGTALYQGVAALFIAQVFQMDLDLGAQVAIVGTATMASIGAAGVPGAGMVTLAMVLTTAGIPTVGVALILGVDRLLDMFRTSLNVTGDLAVTAVMARLEGETLQPLSEQADRADPTRGFEGRLDREQVPLDPDEPA